MKPSKLIKELALALEVASIAQAWGNPSLFQDKINELLVMAGRKPVEPNDRAQSGGFVCCCCGDKVSQSEIVCKVCRQ